MKVYSFKDEIKRFVGMIENISIAWSIMDMKLFSELLRSQHKTLTLPVIIDHPCLKKLADDFMDPETGIKCRKAI